MTMPGSTSNGIRTGVVVVTADAAFDQSVRATFTASPQIDLRVVTGSLTDQADRLDVEGATVVIIDLDAANENEMQALDRLTVRIGAWPPVVAVTQSFDADVARRLMQMRVSDFLVKLSAQRDFNNLPAKRQTPMMRKLLASAPHNAGCVSGVLADMTRAMLGEG